MLIESARFSAFIGSGWESTGFLFRHDSALMHTWNTMNDQTRPATGIDRFKPLMLLSPGKNCSLFNKSPPSLCLRYKYTLFLVASHTRPHRGHLWKYIYYKSTRYKGVSSITGMGFRQMSQFTFNTPPPGCATPPSPAAPVRTPFVFSHPWESFYGNRPAADR
jgi:hypothetical protein